MTKVRMLVVTALAVVFGLGFAGSALAQVPDLPGMGVAGQNTGGLEAPAVGELGDASHGPCVEDLLNLPALHSCVDAEGRVIMDLPALKLVSPRPGVAPVEEPRRLPVTGMNATDFAAIGAAIAAAGFVLLRRVRLALAS